ncbi:MAG TPA: RnfABCDGE type electron transport complex subunit D, partial [Gammaproteobacteria bacterium]|nr:RnfABCDGE type electron transport complex subunit D [Gammaproteobacteria bacterium]
MTSIDTAQLMVSMSPHLRGGVTVERMMGDFLIALIPTAVVGVVLFGTGALLTVLLSVATAVAVEAAIEAITGRELTVRDLHAVVIGLLTGLILPPTAPWWLTMVGAGTAVILGKMVFGGLGTYPFNPPLVAWVVLKLSWPERMNAFVAPFTGERVLTPLMAFTEDPALFYSYDLWDLFLGDKAGPIGTVCGLAIIAGGVYLLMRGLIRWHIPVAFLAGIVVVAGVMRLVNADLYPPVSFHVAGGGALLGALFLAPEPVTSPVTVKGMLLFGFLAGVLAMILRMWGADYDGTFYAILVMNAATPLFNALAPR